MSKPYDYMIARMLLDIANKSEGVEFTNVEYASGEVGESSEKLPSCAAHEWPNLTAFNFRYFAGNFENFEELVLVFRLASGRFL